MKKTLFETITSWENLITSFRKAALKTRVSTDSAQFIRDSRNNLALLREQVVNNEYSWGPYTAMQIDERKKRVIHKAPLRDRILHHAVFGTIEPLVDELLSSQSYACRNGKGTGEAIHILMEDIKHYSFALKMDVENYFPSIDHSRMKEKLREFTSDVSTLGLLDKLIDSHAPGLPIGCLTSQLFANYYLNDLDKFAVEDLKLGSRYFRYLDDVIVLANSREELTMILQKLNAFVIDNEKVRFAQDKTDIFSTEEGLPFLGHRFYRNRKPELLQKSYDRFSTKLQNMRRKGASEKRIKQVVVGWYQHARMSVDESFLDQMKVRKYLPKDKPVFVKEADLPF